MLIDVLKILKAKLYPNRTQARALTAFLGQACFVFNRCLAERRDAYKAEKKSVMRFDQTKHLTKWRSEDKRLKACPVEIARDGVRRVDLAFQSFFRRVKAKSAKVGYPRFKPASRYNSFSVSCDNAIQGNRVKVPGITKAIGCRGLVEHQGMVKRLTVVRRPDGWFARVLIDDGITEPKPGIIKSAVGLDMGLNSFVTTSDGECVACPKFYRKLQGQLRRAQKRVSRRKKGSHRRRKAVLQLQLVHQRIADCRDDFSHKLSKRLVGQYDFIAAEKLNVKGMVRSTLAKSILDAGWSGFLNKLSYKMARAGRKFVQVNPANTSRICSQCGQIVPKSLSDREHKCPCGLVLDRDENAARNVLALGFNTLLAVGGRCARGGIIRPAVEISGQVPLKREVLT